MDILNIRLNLANFGLLQTPKLGGWNYLLVYKKSSTKWLKI